jgi:hypothetical protein
MPEIELFKWWLPAKVWEKKGKPYLSSWVMDAEQAKMHNAIRPELSTREVRQVTPGDINTSFSHLGGPPPGD